MSILYHIKPPLFPRTIFGKNVGIKQVKLTPSNYNFSTWMSSVITGKSVSVNSSANSGSSYGFKLHSDNQNNPFSIVQPTTATNYVIKF